MGRNSRLKKTVQKILDLADIKIDGTKPWDIQVKDDRFYQKVLAQGSLGLGESYMNGWWTCERVDELITKILNARLEKKVKPLGVVFAAVKAKVLNLQTKSRAKIVGEKHYDAGNELYTYMLDKRMTYTCGYWKDSKTLDQAQEAKLDLICKKLKLKPGMTVLDIGCGWGSFAKFAAEKYKVKVTGVTISKEQAKLARENCKNLPVEIRLQDYRDVKEKFDRVLSIGMFEHVGLKNYKTYMKVVNRCLKNGGITLLHTIGGDFPGKSSDTWIEKYIFPNGKIPTPTQILNASEKLLVLRDWHEFGNDYDKTLMAWHKNFTKSWNKIKDNYDERFYGMWTYYLLMCAGTFRAGTNKLWQIVFTKGEPKEQYHSVR